LTIRAPIIVLQGEAMSLRVSATLLAVGALLAAAPPRSSAGQGPPNVILIVVDTLRADRVGEEYAQARALTPFLDGLARRGTRFERAYAPSSWTCPSVASLLTSRYPSQHGVNTFDAVLPETEVTLAESLWPLHYHAAGLTANFRLTADHGYAQGFAFWDALFPSDLAPGEKARGDRMRADLASWLTVNQRDGRDIPLFLYLQFLEPHAPYDPPEPFRGRLASPGTTPEVAQRLNAQLTAAGGGTKGLRARDFPILTHLYDGEVGAVDDQIRQLIALLDSDGVLRNAVIVVTGDHGEEFGEHGEVLHGHTLYDEATRVPLIIVAPGLAGNQVIREPVSLLSVAPTILDLVGAPPEPRHEGRSLVPLMRGGAAPSAAVISELEPLGDGPDFRIHTAAVFDRDRAALLGTHGGVEVYDIGTDPREEHPLPPLLAAESLDLFAAFEQARTASTDASANAIARPVDEATKEKLRALGYQF
jgi:arylsulfatase A-like enzyme